MVNKAVSTVWTRGVAGTRAEAPNISNMLVLQLLETADTRIHTSWFSLCLSHLIFAHAHKTVLKVAPSEHKESDPSCKNTRKSMHTDLVGYRVALLEQGWVK